MDGGINFGESNLGKRDGYQQILGISVRRRLPDIRGRVVCSVHTLIRGRVPGGIELDE